MALPERVAGIVRRQAAGALGKLLAADAAKKGGASIKSLTLAPTIVAKKATYALTCQTLRYLGVVKELLATTDLLSGKKKMRAEMAYVLVYDLVLGQGVMPSGEAERAVLARKSALKAALARLMIKRQVSSPEELLPPEARNTQESAVPRYARVNTLKMTVHAALQELQSAAATSQVVQDDLVPELLVLPPGSDLHAHPLVRGGQLVLQGKASCLPARALDPQPGWTVIDACAAPGNKTTQLAALMEGRGHVVACELSAERVKRLRHTVALMGASNVEVRHCDFLKLDPGCADLAHVKAVLLDPSCSGSGTAAQRLDHLMPSVAAAAAASSSSSSARGDEGQQQQEQEEERVEQLARFQQAALLHALSFPAAERVVYSTCSVHQRENEDVVAAVLPHARAQGFQLAPAFPAWPHRGLPLFPDAHCLVRMEAARDKTDGFFVAMFSRRQRMGLEEGATPGVLGRNELKRKAEDATAEEDPHHLAVQTQKAKKTKKKKNKKKNKAKKCKVAE
eukprot:jgi/Mesen1/8744/ME000052S08166